MRRFGCYPAPSRSALSQAPASRGAHPPVSRGAVSAPTPRPPPPAGVGVSGDLQSPEPPRKRRVRPPSSVGAYRRASAESPYADDEPLRLKEVRRTSTARVGLGTERQIGTRAADRNLRLRSTTTAAFQEGGSGPRGQGGSSGTKSASVKYPSPLAYASFTPRPSPPNDRSNQPASNARPDIQLTPLGYGVCSMRGPRLSEPRLQEADHA